MINKKTTGVPNVDRVTDDIYNHLNKMTSTPTVGLKGERGNTGIQGIPGVTGLIGATGSQGLTGLLGNTGSQGATGIGYNYTLSPGNGLTGAQYNGTSNVTWAEAKDKNYLNYRQKSFVYWVMPGYSNKPLEKWAKVLAFELGAWGAFGWNGILRPSRMYVGNAEYRMGIRVKVHSSLSYTCDILFEKYNSLYMDLFDDLKVSLIENNGTTLKFEAYLHIKATYGSAWEVIGDFAYSHASSYPLYIAEGVLTSYENLPTYVTLHSINHTGVAGPQGVTGLVGQTGAQGTTGIVGNTGSQGVTGLRGLTGIQGVQGQQGQQGATGLKGIQGISGIQGATGVLGATGLRGLTGIQGQQGTTGIGFNYALSPAKGLTGLNYNGTSNVTWIESHIKDFGNGRNRKYAYWGMQGKTANPTGVWVKVASFTLGAWRKVLISGIIRNHTQLFPLSEEKLGVAVYTTDTTNSCSLQYEKTNSITTKIFDDIKVLRLNNTLPFDFEVWLHISNGYGSGYAVQADLIYGEYLSTDFEIYEGLLTAYDNLPAYDTMYSVNVTGVAGPQGTTGIQGNQGPQGQQGQQGATGLKGIQGISGIQGATGLRGLTGIQGQQGATGVGFNYTLTPGNGLTGSIYNGTGNVTWAEARDKNYLNYRQKTFVRWVMPGYSNKPLEKWVRVFTYQLNTWSKITVNGNIRVHEGYFSNPEYLFGLGMAIHSSGTILYSLKFENNNSRPNDLFDDCKIVQTGTGIFEVYFHILTQYGSSWAVCGELTYGITSNIINFTEGNVESFEELPTGITTHSINTTGVAGPQGVTGIQGQQGPQGNQGPQGQQGATGIGYNYSLTPGNGLTGLSYNGTSNVTIHKDIKDVYSYYTRVICNWGTTNSASSSSNKWIKVATLTLNGSDNSAAFYGRIIGRLQGTNSACLQEIHVGIGQGSASFYTTNYMAYLNTINAREIGQSVTYNKNFKDIKLVHVSGSGITNNVVEVWLQYQNNWMDNCLVEIYYRGSNVVMLTNRDAYYDTYPGTYITLLNRNGSAYADSMGLGTSNGYTGICLSVGGNAAIHTTPTVTTTPSYYMVKESGSSEIRQYPWTADHLSAERSLAIAIGDIGWYTIATCPTGRAHGEFLVYDTDSGRHNFCKLQASTAYGKNNLSCTQANRYGTTTILNARIIYLTADRTYGGAKLQVYVDSNCTLRVRQFLGKDINGWDGWDDVAPVKENISAWSEDTTTRIEDVTNPIFGLQANSTKVNNLYTKGNIYLRDKADSAWLNFAVRDTAGSEALYDLSNIGDITLAGYFQHNAMTASRVTVWDANKRLASSSILISELGLLSGKNSVIDGSGTSNYIPSFSSTYRLTDSPLLSGPYSVSLRNSNWTWGSSFAALQIGNMALWANYNVVNGYGTYISNNRRHDGSTGNMAVVNGGSSTYSQDGSAHEFYVNSGLTAGQAFTPTKICSINSYSLDYYPSGGDGITLWGTQGYINSISATNGANSQLQLQAAGSSLKLQDGLILFAANMYCYNSLSVSENITAGIDMTVTRYLHSNNVRAHEDSGMVTLSGYNGSAAIIFVNSFIGHQPYAINSGTQTVNPQSGYIQLVYGTSSTYTLGTMPMKVNTRVIIANISGVSHTVVHNGVSSTLNSGSFREYIYNVYNNVGTWISEW